MHEAINVILGIFTQIFNVRTKYEKRLWKDGNKFYFTCCDVKNGKKVRN